MKDSRRIRTGFMEVLLIIPIFVFLFTGIASASQWAKTYDGSSGDTAECVQQTSDGGYVVAGWTSFGTSRSDAWVLKLDVNGNLQWQKAYGGSDSDCINSIQQTSDGGYIVVGKTYSFGAGSEDVWILKLDVNGNVQWQKTYGGSSYDCGESIQQTSDGGYIVAGYTQSFGAGSGDIWVLKLDVNGNLQWQKTYGGSNYDCGESIQQTSDGGYIVAGWTSSFGAGFGDVWVLKLDGSGNVQWQKAYGGNGSEESYSIQQTSDGGYIVAGFNYSFDAWVLKLDGSGNVQWQKTYGGTSDDLAYSIQQTSDGGYIVGGATDSFGAGRCNTWVLKLNSDGTIAWQETYGGSTDEDARFIQQTSDGGYIVAGMMIDHFGTDLPDVWVLKLDAAGKIPYCSAKGGSNAVVNDTNVTITNTTVTGTDTAVSPQTSIATITDTNATVTEVCYYEPITPPTIGYSPTSFSLTAIQGGSNPTNQTLSITNAGGSTLNWSVSDNASWLSLTPTSGTNSGTITVSVNISGLSAGAHNATITITAPGATNNPVNIPVTLTIMPISSASQWIKTYGGTGFEQARSIQQTSDGGYIMAGVTLNTGWDTWILKLDGIGNMQWQKTYGGSGWDQAYSIQQTSDSGYIVAGYTASFGAGSNDAWLLKLDSNGNVQWQKTYGGSSSDYVNSIQQTSDGGYIVAGYTLSFGAGNGDIWVLKLDGNGNVQWQKTYGGRVAYSVQQTSDGGYIVAGDYGLIFKLDANGNVVWTVKYPDSASFYSIQQTSDGGYIVAGTYQPDVDTYDAWVLKVDTNGEVVWEKTYGGLSDDYAYCIQQTSDGGYIVIGTTESFGAGSVDAWVLKLNPDGTIGWQKTYGGSDWDQAYSIQQTSDGGYIAIGTTLSFGAGFMDAWLLKLDDNGNIDDCSIIATSNAGISTTDAGYGDINVTGINTSVTPLTSTAIPANTNATVTEVCYSGVEQNPVIDKILGVKEPGLVISIIGSNFGDTQGDSVVHIGARIFDSSSPRIKLWSDTKIRIKLPNYQCGWFKGQDYKYIKVWVTVDGVDSNKKRIKVIKPDTCP